MKASTTTPPFEYKKGQVYLSSLSSNKISDGSSDIESRSVRNGVFLTKSPSQTSFLDSASQVGAQIKILNTNIQDTRYTDNFGKKSVIPGKQNVGDKKLTDIISKPTQTQIHSSTFLSTLGTENSGRYTVAGTSSSPVPKSRPKDPKIQELIESNVPKMTRNKEYYIQKLIECENALRTKDKKLKVIEKNQRELQESLDKVSASQLMYKTQLQALQRHQSGRIHDTEDLKFQLQQLQVSSKKKESVWNITKTNLEFEISNLKQKIQYQATHQTKVQTQLEQQNETTASLNEFKNLYSQSKIVHAQLESRNAELSMKLSTVSQQLSAATSRQQEQKAKYSALEDKFENLNKQNQQLRFTIEQLKVLREKQIETSDFYTKKLEMQVNTLTQSLNKKFEEGEEGVYKLKASYDHLKFQNSQLKIFVETNQAQQVEQQGALKLRKIELENELNRVRDAATADKQLSMKVLGQLRNQLKEYQSKCVEWENAQSTSSEQWVTEKQDLTKSVHLLQQNVRAKADKIFELEEAIDKYQSLSEFTKNQSQQLETITVAYQQQCETVKQLNQTNENLISQISKIKPFAETLNTLCEQLSSFEQRAESQTVDPNELFTTINTTLNRSWSFWNNLILAKPQTSENTFETTINSIFNILGIQQTQGWQNTLLQTITKLNEAQKQLSDLGLKFKEKTKYFETRLHVCKEEDERKTLVISDLKANIKLTEKSLNEASDKLIKCTTLLEQSNQKVLVGEARLADAKNQLSGMYSQLKAENESIFQRNQVVELQLRDLLAKHYEGFYDEIVQRSPEDLLRLDVFLIKSFLSTAIEINHHIKQIVPTSPYMAELLGERDEVLSQIRQYYKQLLQPQIAQVMAYYKPVNQKGFKFQGN